MQSITDYPKEQPLTIAMLSLHSSPLGPLGSRDNGGMSVYIHEISRWLGAAGHHVDIFTCVGNGAPEIDLYPHVRLICLNEFAAIPKESLPRHLPRLSRAVDIFRQEKGLGYDLIHSHYWISGMVGAMLQTQWQVPHVTMFHTLGAAKNRKGSGENETALRIGHEQGLVSAVDRMVAPSQEELANLVRLYRAPREKIEVIPCGVNQTRFQPVNRQSSRRRLGLSPETEVVLFVGRFAPLKGVDTLIEAIAALRAGHPHLQLVIVGGDGPQDQTTLALHRKVRELGIGEAVRFEGRVNQSDLPAYYCAADLLALPSHYESFGLVVLESMACGTPVVATPVGAAAALVRDGVNGMLMATPQSADVAEAIAKYLRTPVPQRPTASQVRASVAHYGWEAVARSLNQLYEKLVRAYYPTRTPTNRMAGGGMI